MRVQNWLMMCVLTVAAVVFVVRPVAAEVSCGHWNEGQTVFTFDGLPGTHDYDFGPATTGYDYSHKFDVTPDGQANVVWELTYCVHIYRESDGAEAVYGKTKYFSTDGSAVFSGDQGDDDPQFVADWGNFPNSSDINFYTVNDANGSNDDWMLMEFWFDGFYPESTVTVQANWQPL